ncbi:hypothetical protein KP509_17G002800 [Ceratopteris richardii]|uniref:DExH-box ATP-dependent RNA helicase DExH9 n=1 Tax=Ceratopteris richardii TaxID=49495 RepID=A0A8T2SSC4_CERRI|nr:hypothetical protein KP509_17G002800 [Ceratopteris richardii]
MPRRPPCKGLTVQLRMAVTDSVTPQSQAYQQTKGNMEDHSNGKTEYTSLHEVSYPPGHEGRLSSELAATPSRKPAKEYPFTLDPFQQEAIRCLESGESVLVSAHTSAGKTVIAEYAIALSLRDNQRVIYTSPIKALSNQKFRELSEEFSDVGLMTGDVTISENASCLVMTTEILRSMQYRGSEVMREVAWIIFDEVHYMRDRERGVVWEESIVMAPKNSRFVFLSATVPNAREFTDWVAKVHQQPCHIVYTDFRPTPLQHYVFPSGGDGLYLVVDEKGTFREENFHKAINAVTAGYEKRNRATNPKRKRDYENSENSDIFKLVKMIMLRQFDPVIVFSFSKRDCESLAMQMAKLDLNNEDEKSLVDGVFSNAMDSLSEDDKKLPQVGHLLPLLKRGIGVHHSGLLPILKEVIEILFQEGLIKCLFATETFSIGLNMPAKTVVFTNVRKFDGDKFRWITSGEYIQMSGRAGRRGLDDRGICILMLDEKLEPAVAKSMVKGLPDPLNSAFHLSYNMLLNQMRCEESDPEALLRKSFYQFQCDRALPQLQDKVLCLEKEWEDKKIEDEDNVKNYYSLLEQSRKLHHEVQNIVFSPQHCLPFLQPGRLARVIISGMHENEELFLKSEEPSVWGVLVNFEKVKGSSLASMDESVKGLAIEAGHMIDILSNCAISSERNKDETVRPVPLDETGEPIVASLPLSRIESLSAIRINLAKDLRSLDAREATLNKVREILRRFPDGLPMLDPEDDMQVDSSSYKKAMRRLERIENLIETQSLKSLPNLEDRLRSYHEKEELKQLIKAARQDVRAATNLVFKDELKYRTRVLRRLGYATNDDVVELKGKVACEISSADELVLSELIFKGLLKDASTEQMVSLLSCFVWQEKVKSEKNLSEDLATLYSQLRETARRIGKVQQESFSRCGGLC